MSIVGLIIYLHAIGGVGGVIGIVWSVPAGRIALVLIGPS